MDADAAEGVGEEEGGATAGADCTGGTDANAQVRNRVLKCGDSEFLAAPWDSVVLAQTSTYAGMDADCYASRTDSGTVLAFKDRNGALSARPPQPANLRSPHFAEPVHSRSHSVH